VKILSYPKFPYPNFWHGTAWCDVDIFFRGDDVLVILRDQDDHEGTSVTNALEEVCRKVWQELLVPHGLASERLHWIHWSRSDQTASIVRFGDSVRLQNPDWRYLPPQDFQKILSNFRAPNQLAEWEQEGSLVLKVLADES
jgi:hypothetical protein